MIMDSGSISLVIQIALSLLLTVCMYVAQSYVLSRWHFIPPVGSIRYCSMCFVLLCFQVCFNFLGSVHIN
jgi:hypothetical protein